MAALRPRDDGAPQAPSSSSSFQARRIPIAVSARHAHLTQLTIERLFGPGHRLREHVALAQPGQYAAHEKVTLRGPRGAIHQVRLVGPPREDDQIELSRSDAISLGIDAPLRVSGDLLGTPGIVIEGPKGRVELAHGVVRARRHLHVSPPEATRLGVRDGDCVEVAIDSEGRDLTFGDVIVRVGEESALELHLDTDEANACGLTDGGVGELRRVRTIEAALSGRATTA